MRIYGFAGYAWRNGKIRRFQQQFYEVDEPEEFRTVRLTADHYFRLIPAHFFMISMGTVVAETLSSPRSTALAVTVKRLFSGRSDMI